MSYREEWTSIEWSIYFLTKNLECTYFYQFSIHQSHNKGVADSISTVNILIKVDAYVTVLFYEIW